MNALYVCQSRVLLLAKVALFAVCLMAGAEVRAQVGEARSRLDVGINGGLAMNHMSFDPTIKQKLHMAPTFGLTLRYTCEKYFAMVCALQVEVNYARLGWKEDIRSAADEPLPDRYQRNQDYIQLPLLARLGWGREEKGFMIYFVAGPQLGYCFHESTEQSAEWTLGPDGNPDRPNNFYAQYSMPVKNKFDYGITAGLGVEFSSAIGHIMLEGRYYYGLSDIYGNSKRDVFARSANGTIMAKMTYLFTVKR